MKRKIFEIIILLSLLMLVGCKNNTPNNSIDNAEESVLDTSKIKEIGSKIKKDEIFIVSENINLCFYKNISHIPSFTLDCLTSNVIDVEKVGVSIGISTPYKVVIEEVKEEEFDLYSFSLFTGYDWKKAKKLEKENNEEYVKYQDIYINEFEKLDASNVGELHHYTMTISLDMGNSAGTESFTSIELNYKNKVIEKKIGNIKIDCDTKNPKKEKSLYACSAAISDILINKNGEGKLNLSQDEIFMTENDVKVESIYLLEENDIQNCNVSIYSENESYNMEWNGKTFQIEKGDKVGVDLTFGRNDFKDKLYYKYSDILVVEYTENGKEYKSISDIYFTTKLTSYEMYAHYFEDINIPEMK